MLAASARLFLVSRSSLLLYPKPVLFGVFAFDRDPLETARLVYYSFKETANGFGVERACVHLYNVLDHLSLALRQIDRQSPLTFYSPNLNRTMGATVEQLNQLLIDPINFVSPIFYIQG